MQRAWWKRRRWKLPTWAWLGVAATFVVVGVTQPDDDVGSPGTTGLDPAPSTAPSGAAESPEPDADAPVPQTVADPSPAAWTASSITDGDTLDVVGPDGRWTVRLIGINAPEAGECFSDEARQALAALATGELVLVSDVSDIDQFDRKLRFVETEDGVDIGAELVRNGHAISRRYEPDTARNDIYDALQADAAASEVGLWAPDACGPASSGASVEVDIHFDADGDDNDNLNDEWVTFTNSGLTPLDLGGWIVADESASHRYEFRRLVLEAGASVVLYTGCGDDTDTERYWCNSGSAVWNNSGDTVFLRDPNGNNVIAESYSGS